jgi:hypothetical protein
VRLQEIRSPRNNDDGGSVRSASAAPPAGDVVLRYVGNISLLVKGGVSGRAYGTAAWRSEFSCDRRDVTSFLASPCLNVRTNRQVTDQRSAVGWQPLRRNGVGQGVW